MANNNRYSELSKGHKSGELKDKINEAMAYMSMAGSMLFAMITIPSMPIIFYLTILFNVILVVVTTIRDL
tara:strand:+ start:793 stop:1002 length:210 start_codon:yes stop_codon:yes gene_type:complete